MKKRNLLFTSICSFTMLAVVGTLLLTSNEGLTLTRANDTETYSVTLDKNNGLTDAEKTAKEFVRNSSGGNPTTFKTYGGSSFAPSSGDFAIARDANGWFYNSTPMNGLESLAFKCSNSTIQMKVFFFNEEVNSTRDNWVANSGVLSGQTEYTVEIPRFENPIKYLVWQQLGSGNNWLKYFVFNYSCASTFENRGKTFNPTDGQTFDIEAVPEATGSIDFDVKWTDLGSNKGEISLALFGGTGWSETFGYKTIHSDYVTGDIPGLYVYHLSDGYVRFTWKLSEMECAGTRPTSINVVHVRGGNWTKSTGYADVNSSVNVIEYEGGRYSGASNFSMTYEAVTLANYYMQIEIKFDEGISNDETQVYIADSSACNQYYGNYKLLKNGLGSTFAGVSFEILDNGARRYTFDFSLCTRGTDTKPTTSTYAYSRAGWTKSSGIMGFRFVAK